MIGGNATLAEVFRHVETLDGDPWPTVRELAMSGDRSLVPPVQAALERYLDKHEWYGRDFMVYILAGLRGVAAFPLLLRAFARPLRGDDRDNFCAWLADIMETDPAACRPTILSFIATGHHDLRSAGLWALGYVIQPGDVELLREALADPGPSIRQDALGALSSLKGDRHAYELMLSAVRDPDAWIRRSAVLHLRWFADAAAVEHLARLIQDPDVGVRSALGETIGHLAVGTDRSAVAADALLSLLADTSPQVRAGAARGLGVLGVSSAVRGSAASGARMPAGVRLSG